MMRASNVLQAACLALFLYHCYAVPIGRVIGCGKADPNLSAETRKYCCESFSLDCEETERVSKAATESTNVSSEKQPIYERLVPRRQLGASCEEPMLSCGPGLRCRQGICQRVRTQEHLARLLERGKAVEREEKMDMEDDITNSFKQSEREGELKLRGQSVAVHDIDPGRGRVSAEERYADSGVAGSGGYEGAMFEEDEVAANVADLLAAELVSLNASQVRGIRDVIAGTLDERAEREDEADRTEPFDSGKGVGGQRVNRTCAAPVVVI